MINKFEASELMMYITLPGYTEDGITVTFSRTPIAGSIIATRTTIIPGETYITTYEEEGRTIVTTIS